MLHYDKYCRICGFIIEKNRLKRKKAEKVEKAKKTS